jgi:hypothetical protein
MAYGYITDCQDITQAPSGEALWNTEAQQSLVRSLKYMDVSTTVSVPLAQNMPSTFNLSSVMIYPCNLVEHDTPAGVISKIKLVLDE